MEITHPDQELFDGAGATKRDLVDYLAAVAERILPELAGRPLSVIRVRPGQDPFMQKNLPQYAPDWIRTTKVWAERSRREITYALCDDERTLLWFGNQRAVEYHPTLTRVDEPDPPITMVMDLDPPEGAGFAVVTAAAHLVRRALDEVGHGRRGEDQRVEGRARDHPGRRRARRWTRSPPPPGRWRPGPSGSTRSWRRPRSSRTSGRGRCSWTRPGPAARPWSPRTARGAGRACRSRSRSAGTSSTAVDPHEFTVLTAVEHCGAAGPGRRCCRSRSGSTPGLVEEGRGIPIARVQAMHEGKRRARARREQE